MAAWIRAHVPPGFRLIASPAARAQETAQTLQLPIETSPLIAPGAPVASILSAAGWPNRPSTAMLVGHQPDLGRAAAFLLSGQEQEWHIDKGALWWLAGGKQVFIKAVASPDLL
jgi:phosphohistidine phosphatase